MVGGANLTADCLETDKRMVSVPSEDLTYKIVACAMWRELSDIGVLTSDSCRRYDAEDTRTVAERTSQRILRTDKRMGVVPHQDVT